MLTEHAVNFKPASDANGWQKLINDVSPLLDAKLNQLGTPFNTLDEERRTIIWQSLGAWSAKIPMLCFTEVPMGRDVNHHHTLFGPYGLVVKKSWLVANGGDRVMYIGDMTPVSRLLFVNLTQAKIATMKLVNGVPMLGENIEALAARTDLLAFVQTREHLWEFEWRIVGGHGIVGGARETGKCLPIRLDDVEYIIVESSADLSEFTERVMSLAARQDTVVVPKVILQSELNERLFQTD